MHQSFRRALVLFLLLFSCATWLVVDGSWGAQEKNESVHRRSALPKFDAKRIERVFYNDVFTRLSGSRPAPNVKATNLSSGAQPNPANRPPGSEDAPSQAGSTRWSSFISATTIEDEVKALKLELDQAITTPSGFAGKGHKAARRAFALLGLLFAIVDQYDGDVRWKREAAVARSLFSRTAANLKAGGSIQVYNEAKKRKLDLEDLIRGQKLSGTADAEIDWTRVADRSPLMQILEARIESNLKQWTADKKTMLAQLEQLKHEAELAGTIGIVLIKEGMDDADDEEYAAFAVKLQQGAAELLQAIKTSDDVAAQKAVSTVSRSCADCHENYR